MTKRYGANLALADRYKKQKVSLILSTVALLLFSICFSVIDPHEMAASVSDSFDSFSRNIDFINAMKTISWPLLIISAIIDIVMINKYSNTRRKLMACYLVIDGNDIRGFGFFDINSVCLGTSFNMVKDDIYNVIPRCITKYNLSTLDISCKLGRLQLCIESSALAANDIRNLPSYGNRRSNDTVNPSKPRCLSASERKFCYCMKCGAKLLSDSAFCYKCGTKVNQNVGAANKDAAPRGQYLNLVEWFCPTCNVVNQNYVKTCSCGTVKPEERH